MVQDLAQNMANGFRLNDYLARIGFRGTVAPDLATLSIDDFQPHLDAVFEMQSQCLREHDSFEITTAAFESLARASPRRSRSSAPTSQRQAQDIGRDEDLTARHGCPPGKRRHGARGSSTSRDTALAKMECAARVRSTSL